MQTVTVSGTTLFHLAALYLGDATQWVRIAQQNNLTDFLVTAPTTLSIPDVDPTAGGGIVVQ